MSKYYRNYFSLAHAWAHQEVPFGHAPNHRMWFDRNVIYSYGRHFPIAKQVTGANGETGVLFTTKTYSPTTTGHVSCVRSAINHMNIIYCSDPESSPEVNFYAWRQNIQGACQSLIVSRKPEIWLKKINVEIYQAKKYSKFMGIPLDEEIATAEAMLKTKESVYEYSAYRIKKMKEEEIKEAKRQASERAKQKRKHKEYLKKFYNFEEFRWSFLYSRLDGRDHLRFNKETNRIETSQAVNIPFDVGHIFYNKIKAGTLKVGDKILKWEVDEVGKDIVIGCHRFPKQYLIEFGDRIFSDKSSSDEA